MTIAEKLDLLLDKTSTNVVIVYLGEAGSYDIKNLYPSLYQNLTEDNFIAVPASGSASCSKYYNDSNVTITASCSFTAPTITYTSSTGSLAVSTAKLSLTASHTVSVSGSANVTTKVYMIRS